MATVTDDANKDESPSKRYRVLVVDDSEGIRDTLMIALGREGYAVTVCGDGQEALELINTSQFDTILLDLKLPGGISGLDILKNIREQRSLLGLPVIIISGSGNEDTVVTALHSGANDYLIKPFDMYAVRARVKTQLTLKQLKEINDRLLRTASHDLKKPVMLMLDVAQQLQEHCPPGTPMTEDGHSSLNLLRESGEYMQRIIEGLLDIRSIHEGQLPITKTPTDLGAIVRQTVVRNSDYAKSKGITLELNFTSDLPHIMADDLCIMQVLDNLIGNAIKFSPPKSRTVVTTRAENGLLVCEISDDGPGIADEDAKKLFTEYAKLKNTPTGKEKSSGLGLAICKELITLHGGKIGARNNPKGGATFWFKLPVK